MDSLLDFLAEQQAGEAARDAAIARVHAHASEDWLQAAARAVAALADTRDEFTTDDVWRLLDGVESTHEPRAMGPVMVAAARRGLIVKTDRVRNSVRPECHARPVAVWRSVGSQRHG